MPSKRPRSLKPKGIAHVGLMVSNIPKSQRFYRDILGLQNKLRHKGVAYVPAGRDLLVLYDKDHGFPKIHFGFRVKSPREVDGWRIWLRRRRIPIIEDVREHNFTSVKFQTRTDTASKSHMNDRRSC